MKKQTRSTTGRTALGALLLTAALGLVGLTLNINLVGNSPSGAAYAQATPTPVPIAPPDTGAKIGYENFAAPGVLVPVRTTEAGAQPDSVEYMGRNAGEPSVGSNWATGLANFQSGLQTLFVQFNGGCPVDGSGIDTWVCRAAPTSVAVDSDPIAFTDRGFTDPLGNHSRVFVGELTLLSPNTVKMSYTDDDGLTWVPMQTGGLASAVDHETIGSGIYAAPVPPKPPGTVYPYAVYYCSQDEVTALCSRSDNGGLNFGPSVPIYDLTTCGSLHGHVKVSPKDGTVYVPNTDCTTALKSDDTQAVVISVDNGMSWNPSKLPVATPGGSGVGSDPAVGIDSDGKVYFLGAANGSVAVVATSDDKGASWKNLFDVSSEFGLKQIAFPAAVGGSSGRAAVAFYGSTGEGDSNAASFKGVWHLYVSHTFDGGLHWTTTDATPNAPMQRSGLLRGGGANITRNLLDFFDITIDRDGRVLVGYVDGCEGGNCKQASPDASGNAYSVTATIARQSSGRRMLAANDPASATQVPGMPSVTQRRIGRVVHLGWSEADTGNSPITKYRIYRGTSPNDEQFLAEVTGTQVGGSYDDLTATDTNATYYYKVLAVNALGSSCPSNEIAAPYVGDVCRGIVMHKNEPEHPEANTRTATPPSLLIDYVAVGEPADRPDMFMFKMKVNDLTSVPPNSRWRIVWNSADAETYPSVANDPVSGDPLYAQQFYVGMTTGPSGAPTFEYGTLSDAGLPAVFVISETKQGNAAQGSNYKGDGTITIYAPRTAFGSQKPQPTAPAVGSLLGAVNGRTLTGDVPNSPESKLERSNVFIDHTFAKAQSDNGYPAATYTVAGAVACETLNNPPTAVLTADPTTGAAPLTVTFDGTGSYDPDFSDTFSSYTFHFGDGSADVSGNQPKVIHTYTGPGSFIATLVVTDSRGATSQNTAEQVIVVQPSTSATPTPTATASPSATASASPSATATATPSATPTASPSATPTNVQLLNISGRVLAQTGDNVGIAGFIISGSGTKRVMARGLGPSLKSNGAAVQGRLEDPYLELHDKNGNVLTNDNWRSTQEGEIEQTGLAPSDDRESAIVKRLPAGEYTAIIRGADGGTGVGLVEIFDLSSTEPGELGNLSVRANVGTDDNVLIDGVILRGGNPERVLFRALGPSLKNNDAPLEGRLQDPALEVYDVNGNLMRANDNWRDAPNAGDIEATGIAPPDDHESAVLMTFQPGNYTAVVRGVNQTTGIALNEAYKLTD